MYGQAQGPGGGGGGGGTITYNGPFTLAGGELTFGAGSLTNVKRLTVLLNSIQHPTTNHNAAPVIQLGSGGGIATSGYLTVGCWFDSSNGNFFSDTAFFRTTAAWGGESLSGIAIFTHLGSNVWAGMFNGSNAQTDAGRVYQFGGTVALGGTLTNFQVNTVTGVEGFTAGGQWAYMIE